jgi:hypothetical protein
MLRSFIPLLLASLGFILFGLVVEMPLFEWQVREIATDSPQDIGLNSSHRTTNLGNSLDDVLYCGSSIDLKNLDLVTRLSWSEKALERVTRYINRNVFPWLWFLLFLSSIYVWWFTIHYKHSHTEAFFSTAIAVMFLCILLDSTRYFYAQIGSLECLEGTGIFDVKLSKIHIETILTLSTSVFAEAGAVGIMLRQIRRAIMQRKESAKLGVG